MAEIDPATGLEPEQDPGEPRDTPDTEADSEPDTDGQDKDSKDKADPELAKAIKARDTAKQRNRELQDKVRELEEKLNPDKVDPVKVANRRLIAAEARVALTGAGLKDAADQRVLLDFLKLDGVSVSNDGEVDTDAIQDQIDSLLAVARKLAGVNGNGRRGPKLDSRDLGGERPKPVDQATMRRRAMLRP